MNLKIPKELHGKVFELTLALYRVTDFFPQGEVLRRQLREKANEILASVTEYGYSEDMEREAFLVCARIEGLKAYLEIARSMKYVRPVNITVLEREYSFISEHFFKQIESIRSNGQERRIIHQERQISKGQAEETRSLNESKGQEVENLSTWQDFAEREPKSFSALEATKNGVFEKEKTANNSPREGDFNISERQKRILERVKEVERVKISDFYVFFQGISSKTIQRDLQDLVARNILKKDGEKRWTVYSLNNKSGGIS